MGARVAPAPSPSSPPCRAAVAVYRPRRPQETPLYRLVQDHFDALVRVHEDEFQPSYGRLRPAAWRAVEKFLDCGLLERGFARVRCERCKAEFLVAFSCKTRLLCPSCHAKRLEVWSDWLHHELLYAVPHRQYVFTVPKRLRPFFLYDRRLLGQLSRIAYRTLRDFMRTTLREDDVVPAVIACIQTHGSLVNFHPHLHLLVTDGASALDESIPHDRFQNRIATHETGAPRTNQQPLASPVDEELKDRLKSLGYLSD